MFEHERSVPIATFAATLSEGSRAVLRCPRVRGLTRGFIPASLRDWSPVALFWASLRDWSLAALFRHPCGIGHSRLYSLISAGLVTFPAACPEVCEGAASRLLQKSMTDKYSRAIPSTVGGQPRSGCMSIAIGPAQMLTPLGVKCGLRLTGTLNS